VKLPLAVDLKSRDGDTGQDQRLVNAYVDVKRGIQFVNKRPSLEAALELPVGTGSFSTLGQALYVWQEVDVDSTNLTTSVVGIRGDRGKKAPDTKALLYFTTQPSNASLNTAISPSIVVTARDKFGNTKTDFTGNVTLSFATNRYAATLSGTLTVAAVAGVATFSNVQINRSGIGFALRATATGAKPATSNTFDIQTVLAFTSLPTSVNVDETFTVVVESVDSIGNTDTNYNGDITLILIPTDEAAVLSGTLTRTAVAGVATFTGLSISVAETYGFVASGATIPLVCRPTSAASATFDVSGLTVPDILVQCSESQILGFNYDGSNAHVYSNPISSSINIIAKGSGVILVGDLTTLNELSVCAVGETTITPLGSPACSGTSANAIRTGGTFTVFDSEFSAITGYTSVSGQIINDDGTFNSSFSNSLASYPFTTGAQLPISCQVQNAGSSSIIFDNGGGSVGDPSVVIASLVADYSDERPYQSAVQTMQVSQVAFDAINFRMFRFLSVDAVSIEVGLITGSQVLLETTLNPFVTTDISQYECGPIGFNSTHLFVIIKDKVTTPVARVFKYAFADWSVTELTSTINKPSELFGSVTYIDRSRMLT